jgi:hypothetical protein
MIRHEEHRPSGQQALHWHIVERDDLIAGARHRRVWRDSTHCEQRGWLQPEVEGAI